MRRDTQISSGLHGGKLKRDCREQSVGAAEEQVVDLEISEGRESKEIWRRPGFFSMAAEARQMPWKRGQIVERGAQKNLEGGAGWLCCRSEIEVGY